MEDQLDQRRQSRSIYPRALEENEIRLLSIRSTNDGTVQCHLETVNLEKAKPRYIALSWCWSYGEQTNLPITVNDAEMTVQTNTIDMLRQVKQLPALNPDGLPFWVDTICINQIDSEDKAAQIKLMRKIYHGASSVWAWLGKATDGTDMFMCLLQYLSLNLSTGAIQQPLRDLASLAERCTLNYNINKDSLDSIIDLLMQSSVSHPKAVPRGLESSNHPLWGAWIEFASRSWFERQWIVQEFLLCRSTIFICGNEFVDWRALWFWTLTRLEPEAGSFLNIGYENFMRCCQRVRTLANARAEAENQDFSASYSLEVLLKGMTIRGAKAERKHDYVYGLLGLVTEDIRERIPINYAVDATDVFMQAFKVACFDDAPAATALSTWIVHDFRVNMDLQTTEHAVSWCPKLDNTCLNIGAEDTFPLEFGNASKSLDSSIVTAARGRPGADANTVKLDVLVLDVIRNVVVSPLDTETYLDAIPFMIETLKGPTAVWLKEIARLWSLAEHPGYSEAMFLLDFFGSPAMGHLGAEERMAAYQRLQKFVQVQVQGTIDRQAVEAAAHAVNPESRHDGLLSTSLSRLRTHRRSTYCLTESRQFGRCISPSVLPGDLVCVVPGGDWLHVFHKMEDRDVYNRITMGWFSKWSDGVADQKTENLRTLEIL